MLEVSTSKALTGRRRTALIYGVPKGGKTVCAATMSVHCPETLPAKEPVELSDILYLQYDPEGSESLTSLNLNAPVLPMHITLENPAEWNSENGAVKIMTEMRMMNREALKIVGERVKDGVTKTVIVDTITFFDADRLAVFTAQYSSPKQTGQLYNNLLLEHVRLMNPIKDLGCNLIVTAHPKFLSDPLASDDEQKLKHKHKLNATSLPGQSSIVPKVTGQSLDKWRGALSNIWPVCMTRSASSVKEVFIRPYGGDGWEGGSRVTGLSIKEPAHLRQLFDKVDKLNGVK